MRRIIGFLVGGAVVLGAGGVAFAGAAPDRPALGVPAAAGDRERLRDCVAAKQGVDRREALRQCAAELGLPERKRGAPHARRALRDAVHGELIVPKRGGPDGEFETVVFDAGKVTAADAASVTLERADRVTVKIALGPDTRYQGSVSKAEDLRPGQPARVVSVAGIARSVHIPRP